MFDAPGPSLVYSAHADAQATSALRARGTEVVALPGADGRVDLTAMLSDLAQRGINELHIEAGERLNGVLLRARLVDELLLYLAPTLLGPGRGMAELPLLPELPGAAAWRFESIERCSSDLRILARRADADAFMG
jgi:diaminohydroxyphosphoribosylaminopyrimidine deaminase/5-amino-6-(5-phosphoribosylamino)uracil reductase